MLLSITIVKIYSIVFAIILLDQKSKVNFKFDASFYVIVVSLPADPDLMMFGVSATTYHGWMMTELGHPM